MLAENLGVGDFIIVTRGELRTREYVDRDGIKQKTTEVIAQDIELTGGRSGRQKEVAPKQAKKGPFGRAEEDSQDPQTQWG